MKNLYPLADVYQDKKGSRRFAVLFVYLYIYLYFYFHFFAMASQNTTTQLNSIKLTGVGLYNIRYLWNLRTPRMSLHVMSLHLYTKIY